MRAGSFLRFHDDDWFMSSSGHRGAELFRYSGIILHRVEKKKYAFFNALMHFCVPVLRKMHHIDGV